MRTNNLNVDVFVLCDAATEQGGKLNMLGVFDSIHSKSEPTAGISAVIVARIRLEATASKGRKIELTIKAKDGTDVVKPFSRDVEFPPHASTKYVIINLIGRHKLIFPKFGEYDAKLLIDGELIGWFPILVSKK